MLDQGAIIDPAVAQALDPPGVLEGFTRGEGREVTSHVNITRVLSVTRLIHCIV